MKKSRNLLVSAGILGLLSAEAKITGPEMWYAWSGGNVNKAGITRDLEEIAAAGVSGIHAMHTDREGGEVWTNICPEQIHCMDPDGKWTDVMSFLGSECRRLGLKLTIQNCPGWSQSGGPWVPIEHAQRDLAVAVGHVRQGGETDVPPIPEKLADADSDWRDVGLLAFPTPLGEEEGELKPARVETRKERENEREADIWEFRYTQAVTARTVGFAQPDVYHKAYSYHAPWIEAEVEANVGGEWKRAWKGMLPKSSWRDYVYPLEVALNEMTAAEWRITLRHRHTLQRKPQPKLFACARQTNWAMKSGRVLRELMATETPKQNAAAWIRSGEIRVLEAKDGRVTVPNGKWTILRFGNVNSKRTNAPAPKCATGWECDKLDPAGIESHYKGYVAYLRNGPLKGKLDGMLVDSWECFGQTWTAKMPEYFRAKCGYEVTKHLPAVFGYVIDSTEATEKFLLDWRRLIGDLITKNYFARMAELAHRDGLRSIYETAFGDIISGDAMEYWKYADEPMCEFWAPHRDEEAGFVACHAYKPVRPCSSAAHVYGKSRVTAEAFTEWGVSWRESPRMLKGVADRHFARGVTHLAINNYLHGPVADFPAPGPTGGYNGTPFTYKQPWWHAMRSFTDYFRLCETLLESGKPANDVLWYLGDAVDHLPDAYAEFPEGYAFDYLNCDALLTRLDVKDGTFATEDGTSWRVLWVPDVRFIRAETQAKLSELARKGGCVVYGGKNALTAALRKELAPDVATVPELGEKPNEDFMWIARRDGEVRRYFVCAGTNGWTGRVTFRAKGEATVLDPVSGRRTAWKNGDRLNLAADASLFVEFGGKVAPDAAKPAADGVTFGKWTLTLPAEEGRPPFRAEMERPESWSSLKGADRDARSFCGRGVYETEVVAKRGGECEFDLGRVETVADVFLNGRHVDKLWCSPYRCRLALKTGANALRIEVSNTWRNRVIYELGLPEKERRLWLMPRQGFWPKATDPFDPAGIW